jgi:hypothetical protein
VFPPVPNVDFYTGRTNQLININVVSGVTGNSGGADTKGGSLSSPSNTITSVTILTPPAYGTLTPTGSTGGFTYRSNPGFSGRDLFTYQVVDLTGIVSKNSTACLFNIGYSGTTGTGANFIFGSQTTINNVGIYVNGVSSTLFTATFNGYTGGTGATAGIGVNSLATNRDDNLVYYVGNTVSGGTANSGKIWAYDYINNSQFLLVDANASGSGFPSGSIDITGAGATYFNRTLYTTVKSSNTLYRINVTPYNPLGTPKQSVTQVAQITFQGSALLFGDIAWNHNSNNLVYVANTVAGGTATMRTYDADTGVMLNTNTITFTGSGTSQVTSSNNYLIYTLPSAGNLITARNLSDGTIINTVNGGFSASDLAEWL